MLHLIERLLPAPVHRALLPLAHRIRHRWRRWSKRAIRGVSVVILNPDGDILLLRHSYGPDVWGLPSGGMKGREDPADCARREVREELGMALDSLVKVGELEEVLSGAPHTAHLFVATSAAQPKPDRREVIEARFFPPQTLPEPLGKVTRRRVEAWRALA